MKHNDIGGLKGGVSNFAYSQYAYNYLLKSNTLASAYRLSCFAYKSSHFAYNIMNMHHNEVIRQTTPKFIVSGKVSNNNW